MDETDIKIKKTTTNILTLSFKYPHPFPPQTFHWLIEFHQRIRAEIALVSDAISTLNIECFPRELGKNDTEEI